MAGMAPPPGSDGASKFGVGAPQVSMPKGGGAIRGIGEKFAANPTTGTGSTTVPIATSPGRGGFGPQLSLSYDSGTGNGPFGLAGASPFLPSRARPTRDCRSTTTPKNPMSSSSPMPRTWCRSMKRMPRARGSSRTARMSSTTNRARSAASSTRSAAIALASRACGVPMTIATTTPEQLQEMIVIINYSLNA